MFCKRFSHIFKSCGRDRGRVEILQIKWTMGAADNERGSIEMGWALAGMVLVIIGLSVVVAKVARRELRILTIPESEIQALAQDLIEGYGGAAADVALRRELDAWHSNDYLMQARWHRVAKRLRGRAALAWKKG
jgi:hypothetical protein